MDAFKRANLKSMLAIERSSKEELMKNSKENELRQRNKRDKESMVKMSSKVTDQLLNISKQLASTTQQVGAKFYSITLITMKRLAALLVECKYFRDFSNIITHSVWNS